MSIGNRIKSRRLELNISVDELSEKLGKNRATIYRYESDEIKNLPITVLEPLADALECTPAYLMGYGINAGTINRVSESKAPYYINDDARILAQEIHDNPQLKMLFDASRKLTSDDINAVLDIVKRMKGNN